MAEYINKAELINSLDGLKITPNKVITTQGMVDLIVQLLFEGVDNLPTIDIVTCGECIHRLCRRNCGGGRPNWFCADGERKEDGD